MRIIITGASSGLGLASAEAFAKDGHNILMLARGEQRLNQAAEELKSKYPLAAIELKSWMFLILIKYATLPSSKLKALMCS